MTGKPLFDKIFAALNLVVVLGAVGLIYFAQNKLKPEPTNEQAEQEKLISESASTGQITPVKVKKLTINLYSRQTRLRYLNLEMDLLPFQEDQKEILKKNENILRDITISLAGDMTPEEANSLSGKILLENRVKSQFNQKIGLPVIKKIFFSNFVIQ